MRVWQARNCGLFFSWIALAWSAPAVADAQWPGLRGPDFDGSVRGTNLLRDGATGLSVTWKRALGSGYSAVSVGDGRVVTMFAAGESDVAAGFDVDSGEEVWRYTIGGTYTGHYGSHDGPLATPLLAGGRVYGLGPRGQLFALDAATGTAAWTVNLVEEHEAVKPFFGFSTSPILVDGALIVEMGAGEGKAVAGFDPDSGELVWSAGDDKIDYQSPIAATIGGQLQVLAVGDKHVFGIEPSSGKVLWTYEHGGDEDAIGSGSIIPVPVGEGRFLLLSKADSSAMIQVARNGSEYEISELWANNSIRGTYVTPVYRDGFLYGMTGRVLTCVDASTGETQWRSREPGDGFLTLVGDELVIITKPGSLHVAKASPSGYEELASTDLFEEHAWSEVAFANGTLFARSMANLARIDVTSGEIQLEASTPGVGGGGFASFLAEVEHASDKRSVVDAFLERQTSFPIIEGPDRVHFVYRGEADDIGIVGDMIGSRREEPMVRVEGTDLYYFSSRLEADASINYGFIKDFSDEPSPDPLNPSAGDGVFGEVSWFAMPAWQPPTFLAEAGPARQGRFETVEWESEAREGQKRTAQVYLPAGFDAGSDRRYPSAYFFAGKEALEDGGLKNVLDNLVGETVEPLIAIFVMPDEENSRGDLRRIDPYGAMVVSELVPMIDEKYPTIPDARARGAIGMGRAGAGALYTALKHPDVFRRVGSQGAFMPLRSETPLPEMVRTADDQPLTIYMGWGTYQWRSPHEAWDTAQDNRELWELLRKRGFTPTGGEFPDGSGWSCWRSRTGELLGTLFPIPRDPT